MKLTYFLEKKKLYGMVLAYFIQYLRAIIFVRFSVPVSISENYLKANLPRNLFANFQLSATSTIGCTLCQSLSSGIILYILGLTTIK